MLTQKKTLDNYLFYLSCQLSLKLDARILFLKYDGLSFTTITLRIKECWESNMFYEITSPYFNQDSEWTSCDGSGIICRIREVSQEIDNPKHLSEYDVIYEYYDGKQHTKDAWNFQIRYKPLGVNNA